MATHRANKPESERRRRSRLAQLSSSALLLRGTLSLRKIKCGKESCHCKSGEPHLSLYLSQSNGGKPQQLYIPEEHEQSVRQAIKHYQELQQLVEELSQQQWRQLKELKTKKKKA